MIKMERTCSSLKCEVVFDGEVIGSMDGVSVTQWFLKNQYHYTGVFSRFNTNEPEMNRSGITVDIIFSDRKIIAKDASIDWIRSPTKNGTFSAKKIEYRD